MNVLSHIASRIVGTPLLLLPQKAQLLLSVLGARLDVDADLSEAEQKHLMEKFGAPMRANRFVGEPDGPRDAFGNLTSQTMYNRAGPVAIIPVLGSLVNRGAFVGARSGLTSYEGLTAQINAALTDQRIGAIMLDINSPGGEASGMFTLADTIRKARQQKPVIALVDDVAASAAYGIASSASEIVGSSTSTVGSIGVVMLHVDQSAELAKKGRKATLIYAGAKKVDGNPLEPLSEEVRANMQREVNLFYDRFVETVAAGRPSLTTEAIRGTEAGIFIGEEAVAEGLIDRIGTFSETLLRVSEQAKANLFTRGNYTMSHEPEIMSVSQHREQLASAVAQARQEGVTEGRREGASTAIERIRAILTAPEAEGRTAVAMVFALDTDMPVEAAKKALVASPAAVAPVVPPLAQRAEPPVGQGNPQTFDASTFWNEVTGKINDENKRWNRH